MKKTYYLMDGRANFCIDDALVLACGTLKECIIMRYNNDYGDDCVICEENEKGELEIYYQ